MVIRKIGYWERDPLRFERDRAITSEICPDLVWKTDLDLGEAIVEGDIILYIGGMPNKVKTKIVFPRLYPKYEPKVYETGDQFPHILDRHFHPDGQCCLWLPPKSKWNSSTRNALAGFLYQVIIFFHKQFIYNEIVDHFPGEEYGHGDDGYVEYILEMFDKNREIAQLFVPVMLKKAHIAKSNRCLCSSGKLYRNCHYKVVEEIQYQIHPLYLEKLFANYFSAK